MATKHPPRRRLRSGGEPSPEPYRQDSPDGYGFLETIWTDVEAVRAADQEIRLAALARLLTKYQWPLQAYLRATFGWRRRVTPEWLEDCFQKFIEQKVMMKGLIAKADRSRGRLRDLLKKALWNFAMQEYRALIREPEPEELEEEPEGPARACPEAEKAWARQVLNDALLQLETGCKKASQGVLWIIFLRRRLFPLAGTAPAESLAETAEHVRLVLHQTLTPQQISNLQKTAERKLYRCIRDVLAEYCPNAEDIEEELLAFIEILKGGISLPTRLRPQPRAN